MKLTKRMKDSIIQAAIANIFFLIILVWIVFLFLYPRIIEIENKKKVLLERYNTLQEVILQGISFWDFKTSIRNSDLSGDSYTSNLMKNLTSEFYWKNFTNSGAQKYDVFLDELRQEITLQQNTDEYIKKDQTLSTVLPIYDEKNIFSSDGLSDFFFINYIENILYSFNLSSKGEIWIGDLEKQGEAQESQQEDGLQEEIYSIPLLLDIAGQKKDVIDFIHYFENVWWIYITGESFQIQKDTFISKKLEGVKLTTNYNIYENQIADITSLSLQDYPDSSSLKTSGLIEAMKGEQSREKINVELELAFYVVGIPWYKMEKYVEDFLLQYQNLSSQITTDAKKYASQAYKFNEGVQLLSIRSLQSLDSIMTALNEDIIEIRKSITKREDVQKTYEQVVVYKQQVLRIETSYNKQLNILTQ